MISNAGSLRWRSLKPFVPTNQSGNSQALVMRAEVVNSSNHIHPCFERCAVPGYSSSSSDKARQTLPERSIESLYEGCVNYSCSLCPLKHSFNLCLRTFNDAPMDANNSPLIVLFDRLRYEDPLPWLKPWTTSLPGRYAFTKHKPNRSNVSLQSIRAKQQPQAQCRSASAHLLNHMSYKSPVSSGCDFTSQPEARAYHQSHSHPHDAALLLDSKLIHLHLPQITWSGDKLFVKRLTMNTGAALPT